MDDILHDRGSLVVQLGQEGSEDARFARNQPGLEPLGQIRHCRLEQLLRGLGEAVVCVGGRHALGHRRLQSHYLDNSLDHWEHHSHYLDNGLDHWEHHSHH